ncbi:hypothetical protein MKW94_026060 [Papaver nudicaule]|uniref:Alkyl transferase n=1 Tax=Papaver nudicaule TaxID=74823 RepID=A0AA41S3M7_PAPNU|nr:hypothetical protein [Papaver nudicaule]
MQSYKTILNEFVGNFFRLIRKFIFSVLSVGPIPTHIAFIMDGNRRFARKNKLKEGSGHRVGFFALMSMLKYCYELRVKYVTVFAFGAENLNRTLVEVQSVMALMEEKIEEILKEESLLKTLGVKVQFIGNLKLLNDTTRAAAQRAMAVTAQNSDFVILICAGYSSATEILNAVQKSYNDKWRKLQKLDSSGTGTEQVRVDHFDDNEFGISLSDLERHMYMSAYPEPDILVRTSGEKRLSNFLLWQSPQTYLYAPAALWPEISFWHLIWMVLNFQRVPHILEKKKKQL